MTTNPFEILITITCGLSYGFLLHLGKKFAFIYKKPQLDIIFSIIRFIFLIIFLYVVLQFAQSSSILLIILFLLAYIGIVVILVNKSIKEKR